MTGCASCSATSTLTCCTWIPARSWARVVRGVFGRAFFAFPNLTLPEWQIEGLAVFEESVGDRRPAGSG